MIGTRRGHYRIVEKIGEGGMGVVYKARDEKLDRFVAVKFLPVHHGGDQAERARFLQEARSASALNHPNVCVVHAIEEHDGEPFIVMEYLEGETLRQRIARGPVPLEQAAVWAIQIGDALREAHSRGVIHRDIKTDNIMITPRGEAKVMDFGLARFKGLGQATHTLSTQGTLAYMAPEQIRDGLSDSRSDLYAFGVVLYELLTGVQPFRGEQQAAVMYAILNTDPEPVQSLRPGLSSGWQHVLDRALEKDPADRYQSMGDMVIELKRLQREVLGVRRTAADAREPVEVAAGPRAPQVRRGLRISAMGAVGLILFGFFLWRLEFGGPPRLNPNMTFRTLDVPAEQISYPGMSSDGKWVAFPAADARDRWDLYFMNVNGTDARRITNDSSRTVTYVDVSPDGSQIAYSVVSGIGESAHTDVRVVSSLGGASRVLSDMGEGARWQANGSRLGYVMTRPNSDSKHLELWSVRADGSDRRRDYEDTLSISGRYSFDWAPDGKSFAWIRSYPNRTQELFVIPLGGGRERQLTHDGRNIDEVCWTRQGLILFSSNRGGNTNLWAMRATGGPAVQVTKGAGPDLGIRVSADGRALLYLQQQPKDRLWIASLERSDAHTVPIEEGALGRPALSSDGAEIAVPMLESDPLRPRSHLVLMNRDGSNRRQLTSGLEVVGFPHWAPTNHRVAFVSTPFGQPIDSSSVWVMDPADPASARVLARAHGFRWVDDDTLYVWRRMSVFRIPEAGGALEKVGQDSVWVWPVKGGGFNLTADFRASRRAIYAETVGKDAPPPRLLFPISINGVVAPHGRFMVRVDGPGRVTRITIPDLRETPITAALGPIATTNMNVSWDGKEIIYTQERVSAKLVLVEHLR